MSTQNFSTWKFLKGASLALAVAGLPASVLAQSVQVEGSAALIGVNGGFIKDTNTPSNWDAFADKPQVKVTVTDATGAVKLHLAMDLQNVLDQLDQNETEKRNMNLDGKLHKIVQELTLSYSPKGSVSARAGLGRVAFSESEGEYVTQARTMTEENMALRERLVAEIGYEMEGSGTKIQLSIFDGRKQAVSDMTQVAWRNFIDVQDLDGRVSESVSGAARVEQNLGQGIKAAVAYARIRNENGDNKNKDRIQVSLKKNNIVKLGDWAVGALLAFSKTYDDKANQQIILGQLNASKGPMQIYALAEESKANRDHDKFRAALGTSREVSIAAIKGLKSDLFAELSYGNTQAFTSTRSADMGVLGGVRLSGKSEIKLDRRN